MVYSMSMKGRRKEICGGVYKIVSKTSLLSDTGIVCNVGGEPVDAPTAKVCCVAMRGMSYEKSIYTIPCIGKLVINTC